MPDSLLHGLFRQSLLPSCSPTSSHARTLLPLHRNSNSFNHPTELFGPKPPSSNLPGSSIGARKARRSSYSIGYGSAAGAPFFNPLIGMMPIFVRGIAQFKASSRMLLCLILGTDTHAHASNTHLGPRTHSYTHSTQIWACIHTPHTHTHPQHTLFLAGSPLTAAQISGRVEESAGAVDAPVTSEGAPPPAPLPPPTNYRRPVRRNATVANLGISE